MIGTDDEKESKVSMLSVKLYNDDDDIHIVMWYAIEKE